MDNHIRYPEIDGFIRSSIKREPGILREMEEYARERFIPIIPPETAAFLKVLIQIRKPLRILEAGTAIGYSSAVMAGAMAEDGIIDTIEIDEAMSATAISNLKRLGLDKKVRVLMGDALDVMQCLTTPYDFIFLDASKGQYSQYLDECLRLLKPGGVLVSDNILYKGLVAQEEPVMHKHRTIAVNLRDYIHKLCNHDKLETAIIPIGDGLTVSVRLD
jgi:predicted O-methyltransferase YrrM